MADSKISPALRERLNASAADEPVEVVVQLQPPQIPVSGSRTERMKETQRTFGVAIDKVRDHITADGGKVLEEAWINSTARVQATPDQIADLQSEPDVLLIDLPAAIHPS